MGETGIAANHHFLVPHDSSSFRFAEGQYRLDVFARLLGDNKLSRLFTQDLTISREIAASLAEPGSGVYFDWGPDSARYLPHADKRPPLSALAAREFTAEDGQIAQPSPRSESSDDYEAIVRAEIGQLCVTAFRPIKLNQGEREVFEEAVFHACCERGWEPPQVSTNPVDPQHMDMGWAWKEGPITITSADAGALRQLANDRARIARQIRDSELGRLLRENFTPKRQAPGAL